MSLRFLSPTVVLNECDRIWRAAMLAGIVVCAVAVLPAIVAGYIPFAAFAAAIVAILGGVAMGASLIARRFSR